MSSSIRYFNFPVEILHGFLENSSEVLKNILCYALHAHGEKYEFDEGNLVKRMKAAAKFYNVKIDDFISAASLGEELFQKYRDKSIPFCGINVTTYLVYRDNAKSDFEKVSLLAYLAIKSILGTKKYCKITNEFMLSRMDGRANSCSIDKLSPKLQKFSKQYQLKKIKQALELDWYLMYYSYRMRGFYVSFELSLRDLVLNAEANRQKYKLRQLDAKKKSARETAIRTIQDKLY